MMSCDDDDDDVSEEDSEDDDRGCWNKSFCAPPVFCAAKNLQAAIFLEAGHCLILAKKYQNQKFTTSERETKIKVKMSK